MFTTRRRSFLVSVLALALILVGATGCATFYSSETVRQAIVQQTGQNPRAAFELNLGRFSTMLAKAALADPDGPVPFAGLERLEFSVYEMPEGSGPIDVTTFGVRGWEPVLRTYDDKRSSMVLIRGSRGAVGDLVLVGGGPKRAIYARLQGTLSRELPQRLGNTLRDEGVDRVRRLLESLQADP